MSELRIAPVCRRAGGPLGGAAPAHNTLASMVSSRNPASDPHNQTWSANNPAASTICSCGLHADSSTRGEPQKAREKMQQQSSKFCTSYRPCSSGIFAAGNTPSCREGSLPCDPPTTAALTAPPPDPALSYHSTPQLLMPVPPVDSALLSEDATGTIKTPIPCPCKT